MPLLHEMICVTFIPKEPIRQVTLCRVDLGVAAQAPHRPGRAQLTHPVLRAVVSPDGCPSVRLIQGSCTSSLASLLLSPCCECRFLESSEPFPWHPCRVHRIFPGVPLRSGGSLWPRFATISATMRTLRQPPRPSLLVSFPSQEAYCVHAVSLCLRSSDSRFRRRACLGPGCCYAGSRPCPALYAEPCGSPRFLCSLLHLRPALRPRRCNIARPFTAMLFRPQAP